MPRNIAWHLSLLGCLVKRSASLIGRFDDAQGIARRGGTPIVSTWRGSREVVSLSLFLYISRETYSSSVPECLKKNLLLTPPLCGNKWKQYGKRNHY